MAWRVWLLICSSVYLFLVLRPTGNLERLWEGVVAFLMAGDLAALLHGLYVLTPFPHFLVFALCLVAFRLPRWVNAPAAPRPPSRLPPLPAASLVELPCRSPREVDISALFTLSPFGASRESPPAKTFRANGFTVLMDEVPAERAEEMERAVAALTQFARECARYEPDVDLGRYFGLSRYDAGNPLQHLMLYLATVEVEPSQNFYSTSHRGFSFLHREPRSRLQDQEFRCAVDEVRDRSRLPPKLNVTYVMFVRDLDPADAVRQVEAALTRTQLA